MKNETPENSAPVLESWIKDSQLSPDDLEAVTGGLISVPVKCDGTYCKSTYSGLKPD
ncbi:hypothetical protein [Corallococcus sp. AS-1-12]|uniref:hypothetical protein n=1 Tax=Corallococcus sp. AS-1-12 TaxID=2874598 RepID=UPI001CC07D52|nr:hypothetical protein [Corallococcus sp. AS-1-12]MBZ4329960.1 hypothetical protein [Corallococcus sp. AS-1-12]